MELHVDVEKPSKILRKLTIRVPAKVVTTRVERGLAEVQRTARIKGFRPGNAPITIIRQFYGEDVRHRVFHSLIDESFREAVREQQLKTVGAPRIETPEHKTGGGDHDHAIEEGKDLTYTATVEVLPEIEVKGFTGVALTKGKVVVDEKEVDAVVNNILDSRSELVAAAGGLVQADGTQSSRPVQKGDFVDLNFSGGVVTDKGVEEIQGMKGSRVVEVGAGSLIPGFEENLIGMRQGETKTFRLEFPKEYGEESLAGKPAEFTATVNEVKEKKVPALNEDFAKEVGYESIADMRAKAKEHITRNKAEEADRKLRSDLLQALIEKNPFDVPEALVQAQTRALAQDVAGNLSQQGFDQGMIQQIVAGEFENLKKRAENQVRASLILESIAKAEKIEVPADEIELEIKSMAVNMKIDEEKLREYYTTRPEKREDLVFRMREERTVKFLFEKAKIKQEK